MYAAIIFNPFDPTILDDMVDKLISANYKVPFLKFKNSVNSVPRQLDI